MPLLSEGPRERLARLGAHSLTDEELLGLILTGGSGGQAPAAALLRRLGGLSELSQASVSEVRGTGIGWARGAALCAALELGRRVNQAAMPARPALRNARQAYAFLRPRLAHLPTEVFSVTLLDVRLRVLRELTVAQGTGWSCAVNPRDALAPAVRERAAAVLFAHNHPSGDAAPSEEDRSLTRRLVAACELLGLRALDHLVVCRDGYASLRELGEW
jgi:DNA repair protein RadC